MWDPPLYISGLAVEEKMAPLSPSGNGGRRPMHARHKASLTLTPHLNSLFVLPKTLGVHCVPDALWLWGYKSASQTWFLLPQGRVWQRGWRGDSATTEACKVERTLGYGPLAVHLTQAWGQGRLPGEGNI